MKKYIIISILALGMGSAIFAKGYHCDNYHDYKYHNSDCVRYNKPISSNRYIKNALKGDKEYKNLRIELEEKKLERMKEMAKDTPNFNNIDKINEDILKIKSKMKTIRMRVRYENAKVSSKKSVSAE